MKAMEVKKMNNYYWNKRNVSLDKDEIAPWKLPREKHATISVLLHRENELQTVDDISQLAKNFTTSIIKSD